MKKEKLEAMLEMLEWVIKLSYCGMPMGMFRYWVLKKHEELLCEVEERQESGPKGSPGQ